VPLTRRVADPDRGIGSQVVDRDSQRSGGDGAKLNGCAASQLQGPARCGHQIGRSPMPVGANEHHRWFITRGPTVPKNDPQTRAETTGHDSVDLIAGAGFKPFARKSRLRMSSALELSPSQPGWCGKRLYVMAMRARAAGWIEGCQAGQVYGTVDLVPLARTTINRIGDFERSW
jgi:hypothetical protein